MILAIDIGNTNIVLGLFDKNEKPIQIRIRSDNFATTDEYASSILFLFEKNNVNIKDIDGVIIGSVVPRLQFTMSRFVLKYMGIKAMTVGAGIKSGVSIRMENHKEIGADRIANAVSAINKFGSPCIVIDFGTATTFDIVNKKSEYIGGVICPGVNIAVAGLHSNTAKLPEIEITKPEFVVGKNTVHSMQSGVYYGYAGLVNGLIERIINEEFSDCSNVHIISTGGLGRIFLNDLKYDVKYEPFLTLEGLKIIYEKNK